MFLFSHLNISTDVVLFLSIHRCAVVRSGNNTGRVRRVVSCKRKSHHPLARRKPPGKTFSPSNNDGQQEIFSSDALEFPVITNNRRRTGDTDLDQNGCRIFSEVRHITTALITHCPFERNYKMQMFSAFTRSQNNDWGAVWEELETKSVFNTLAQKCWRTFGILAKVCKIHIPADTTLTFIKSIFRV